MRLFKIMPIIKEDKWQRIIVKEKLLVLETEVET